MITVEQATEHILNHTLSLAEEIIPLHLATGKVLCEPLVADRHFPPFHRVSMDGIAIRNDAFKKGKRKFKIEGLQAAGAPQMTLQDGENCVEIMTGAMLTENTDVVIRYEDVEIKDGYATVQVDEVSAWQNIHRRGTDRPAGSVIAPAGGVISAAEIGVAATVGKTHLKVAGTPKVAIISTGDELVEVGDMPLPYQIRKSNVHTMGSAVEGWGVAYNLMHLPDNKETIRKVLSEALKNYDALLLSGGVSAGKLDFVPEVLDELQVEKLFHKVTQRPGKPFWFGYKENGAVVFAFPGNPVSSFMCLNRYFKPWLRASRGLTPFEKEYAVLSHDFHFKPDLTYFLQVQLESQKDGTLLAHPVEGKGSGDLANLVDADGFMELPKGEDVYKEGEVFEVMRYR